jgi:hypothetical protein
MDRIIVYVDDAGYAEQQLLPMRGDVPATRMGSGTGTTTHWVVVACAPRMTHRISKWVSHSARENWRAKWSEKLFDRVLPLLQRDGDVVTPVLAKGPLAELTARLQTEHGQARVMDARRPKFGHDMEPVTKDQPASEQSRWTVPGAVAGMGAILVLAAD